jgi:hypothetical protein
MYKINQDIHKNLVTIDITGEVDASMVRRLLDDLNEGRKVFKAGYSAVIKLGKDLDFVDSMFAAMDLTAFKAKVASIHKVAIQVPFENKRSRVTAEKLLSLYARSEIKAQITETQIETNKWLEIYKARIGKSKK